MSKIKLDDLAKTYRSPNLSELQKQVLLNQIWAMRKHNITKIREDKLEVALKERAICSSGNFNVDIKSDKIMEEVRLCKKQ